MPEWLKRLVSGDSPDSPKALVLYQSATTLDVVFASCGLAAGWRIASGQPLPDGTTPLILGLAVSVAGLAGFHRQQDPGQA